MGQRIRNEIFSDFAVEPDHPFPSVQALQSIQGPIRDRLHGLDRAIAQMLTANSAAARFQGLNEELLATATITLLLTVAARHRVDVAKRFEDPATPETFGALAQDALRWAMERLSSSHN